jgi:hypothetical protein
MSAQAQLISVLAGPTCSDCLSDDLRWTIPLGSPLPGRCRHCGTDYLWFRHASECPSVSDCPGCGPDISGDFELCEDCELSDCAYCGSTTHRFLLSENLACALCEGEAA